MHGNFASLNMAGTGRKTSAAETSGIGSQGSRGVKHLWQRKEDMTFTE